MKAILPAFIIATLTACGGGGSSSSSDPYVAALQAHFDADQPSGARSGKWCFDSYELKSEMPSQVAPYKKLGVISGPQKQPPRTFGPAVCWTVKWPASVTVLPSIINHPVIIGRYVVDKVGPEQSGPLDIKYRAYNAHFEPTTWGSKIIAAGLATPAPALTDAQASFHQDADGHLVADQ